MKKLLAALLALWLCAVPALAEAPEETVGAPAEEAAAELDAFELGGPEPEAVDATVEAAPEPEAPGYTAENGAYGVDLSSRGYGTLNPFTGAGLKGTSMWYCWGRAYEKCGVRLGWEDIWQDAPGDWYARAAERAEAGGADFAVGDAPGADAIAVYGDRVVFIEALTGDVACITECEPEAGAQAYNEREIDLAATPPLGYIYLRFSVEAGQCGDGVTWTLNNDGTLEITGQGPMWDYTDSPWRGAAVERVTVGEGVTVIGAGAFMGVQMKSVTLPGSVTRLGTRAFKDCARLKRAMLPEGLTTIPELAFGNCWQLDRVDLPASLVTIEQDAFWRSALSELEFPEGLERIGAGAFARTALTALRLPASLTALDPRAFEECYGIAHIDVAEGSAAYMAVDDALYTRDGEALIYCAPAREGRFTVAPGTRIIGKNAFGCSALSEILLPEGLEIIADDAFDHARYLSALDLPASLVNIGTSELDAGGLTVRAVYGTEGHAFCRREDARHRPGGVVTDYLLTAGALSGEAALNLGERLMLTGASGCASSQPEVASVTGDGLIAALSAGTAEISFDGGTLTVAVSDPFTPTRIDIEQPDGTLLPMDSTLALDVTFTPDTAACAIQWHSSDTTVATVDGRGVVNPVGEGGTLITAVAGGLSDAVWI